MNTRQLLFIGAAMAGTLLVARETLAAPRPREARQPVRDLRDSARRILADPEFRHFEHFADDAFSKSEPPQPNSDSDVPAPSDADASPATSGTENDGTNTAPEAEPWWRKALNRAQPSGSGSDSNSSRKQRLSPSGSAPTGDSSTSDGDPSASDKTGETAGESNDPNRRGTAPSGKGTGTANKSQGATKNNTDSKDIGDESSNAGDAADSTGSTPGSKPAGQHSTGSRPSNRPGSRSSTNADSTEPSAKPNSSGDGEKSTGTNSAGSTSNTPSGKSASKPADSTAANPKAVPQRDPGDAKSAARPARTPTERPTRTQRPGAPSQRGSDGVERPVRQASRTPQAPKADPSVSQGPEWSGPSLAFGTVLGGLFHGLAYVILAVIIVAIVVLVAQALMQAWSDRPRSLAGMSDAVVGPLTHDRSPGETEADVFVREALALAQRGEYRAAIGRLVLGGMSYIERQQWIRYRRGLTVHDYLRVLRSRPDQFAGFRQVVHVFEPVEYGRRPATEPLFDAALSGYRRGFPASPIETTTATPATDQ